MASINSSYFGCPRGRVGDLIYKVRDGKPYVSTAPTKYTVSNSPKCVHNRNKFSLFANHSKAMNQVYLIKSLWKEAKIPGNCNQNKQMNINYSRTYDGFNIDNIKLFPRDTFFSASVLSSVMEENNLKLTVELLESAAVISEKVFRNISVHGLIKLQDNSPIDPMPVTFLPLSSDDISFVKGVPLQFVVPLFGEDLITFNSYPQRYFTLALVIKNRNGEAAYFSKNVNGEWTT